MSKIVKPNVSTIDEQDIYKRVEIAGRTCYKSEDKINENSAKAFVGRLCKNNHLAMLEHSNLVFVTTFSDFYSSYEYYRYFLKFRFLNVTYKTLEEEKYLVIISGNLRFFLENNIIFYNEKYKEFNYNKNSMLNHSSVLSIQCISPDQICYIDCLNCNDIKKHRYTTMRFICDRGVSHELVRHRLFSFAQESTRYVNYNKKEFTVIEPSNYESWSDSEKLTFNTAMDNAYLAYKQLLLAGLSAQQARAVLPNATKTEIVVTGNEEEWFHFFKLRCASDAHPDMQIVANKAKELYENKYNIKIDVKEIK